MNLHCPSCHAQFSIEMLTQDEAARELLASRPSMLPGLLPYLTLFRTGKRALPFDKALQLAKEVMALTQDLAALQTALADTVESIKAKREEGQFQPLKNHNYLLKVLQNSTPGRTLCAPTVGADGVRPGGKRVQALEALAQWGASDWLRSEIAIGLQALLAQSLKCSPAVETITMAADVWFLSLAKSCTIEEIDAVRIRKGFVRLFAKVDTWPAVKQLIAELPDRPYRPSLPLPKASDAEYADGAKQMRDLSESFK